MEIQKNRIGLVDVRSGRLVIVDPRNLEQLANKVTDADECQVKNDDFNLAVLAETGDGSLPVYFERKNGVTVISIEIHGVTYPDEQQGAIASWT